MLIGVGPRPRAERIDPIAWHGPERELFPPTSVKFHRTRVDYLTPISLALVGVVVLFHRKLRIDFMILCQAHDKRSSLQ